MVRIDSRRKLICGWVFVNCLVNDYNTEYTGVRGSVPAFLAACQLKLADAYLPQPEDTLMYGNEHDDMDHSAGPSFSILHED